MVVYSSYITYVNTRACANGAELAFFEIIFLPGKKLDLEWIRTGIAHHCLHH